MQVGHGTGPPDLAVLDSETGRRRPTARAAATDDPSASWSRPPLAIDDDHACITLDPRTVALIDVNTGARVWTSRVASDALPRTGPPRILGDSSRLLVVYEGNELIRLDPATGRKLWSRSLGLDDLSESPDAFALDADRLYCATGATLAAYRLGDGEPTWTRHLSGPKAGWSVALAGRYVTAYPRPDRGEEEGAIQALPLVVCRRDDGALVQRVAIASPVKDLAVSLQPHGAIVATQAGAWALGPPPPTPK